MSRYEIKYGKLKEFDKIWSITRKILKVHSYLAYLGAVPSE